MTDVRAAVAELRDLSAVVLCCRPMSRQMICIGMRLLKSLASSQVGCFHNAYCYSIVLSDRRSEQRLVD